MKDAIATRWKDLSRERSRGQDASRNVWRFILRLSEEEKLPILGPVATLILRSITTADPRVNLSGGSPCSPDGGPRIEP